ncbi:MAG: ABC transporter permease [Planctomycetes bacterium]|nr:ABC transporter permease [Planctomycetota bacterium]MCB9830350.1 ABC transporter permease [Planctomycetota bacterium]MCB9900650.1 ABC transporter permease [Planctomycetota bacterium]
MSLLALAWRSVRGRPLASALTIVAVALGAALVISLLSLRASTRRSFLEAARGYDAILGPTEGSPLDTVLSTLFHVGESKGTIPFSTWEAVQKDPRVALAVPYALGDSFRGRHIVGTSADLFRALSGADGKPLGEGIVGALFEEGSYEAVVGSAAAASTGLRRGSQFRAAHGVEVVTHEHEELWTVVGIMRPTGTPADRAIFIPWKTFYSIGGHEEGAEALRARRAAQAGADGEPEGDGDHDGEHDHEHEADDPSAEQTLGMSAIGIRLVSPGLRIAYIAELRQDRDDVDPVQPLEVIHDLLQVVGSVDQVFELLAWAVVIVSGLGILVGLYNTIHGRRREIAILRALGARARHVFVVIVLEALLLVLAGGILGLVLGHFALAAAAPELLREYAIRADIAPGLRDVAVLGALLGLGLLAGLLPALRGLRTPVARNLQPQDA